MKKGDIEQDTIMSSRNSPDVVETMEEDDIETEPSIGNTTITNSTIATEESTPDEHDQDQDDSRAQATFRFTVENISQLRDSVLSPPCMIRNLPWKIMVMPRANSTQQRREKNLGFFVQCNGDSDSTQWSCSASAELSILSHIPDMKAFMRRITHTFYCKENDWGFSHFISWDDLMSSEKGYVKDNSITLEASVTADAPHGVSWDSKRHTGFVGLKNQGATCYLNSLLQTLFFTQPLRRAVYLMPTESDDSNKSVALALQRVFYELQFSDKPVGTKKLTKSFGWESYDTFMQHDVQELSRVLLDNMETKMKGTCVEGTIPQLFEGKMQSYIRCKHVSYGSSRSEPFYDLQLNVKNKKNVVESFRDYTAVELLEGENKYDAGEHGLQEAEKGITFISFPDVLHLQLMRCQYDPTTDQNVKINDRFEFSERLSLDEFLQSPELTDPANYLLHAVLVHTGDNHGGHYIVYIRPSGEGKWCKFDDDVVSRCPRVEAIEQNFGGSQEDDASSMRCSNAYMLVYIRDSKLSSVLRPVTEEHIPEALVQRLQEEKRLEAIRRKERNEAHLYLNVHIVTEEEFYGHQGYDLFDMERCNYRTMRVLKVSKLCHLIKLVSEVFKYPVEQIRLWPFNMRHNHTLRPIALNMSTEIEKPVLELADQDNPWIVYLETVNSESSQRELPIFDEKTDVLLFFKLYDPKTKTISYLGHMYLSIVDKLSEIVPRLCTWAGFSTDTSLIFFEEVKPNQVERIQALDQPLENVVDEISDGDILVIQKDEPDLDITYELSTAVDYFRDLYYRIEVIFCDKMDPNDQGFSLELSQRMNYHQMANAVAHHLNTHPYLLQFFKVQSYREIPGTAIRCTYEGQLKDLLSIQPTHNFRSRQPKRLYYQQLSIPIDELENKRPFRCVWVSDKLREEKEMILYPDKDGKVLELLEEAQKHIEPRETPPVKLRLLEVLSFKILCIRSEDMALDCLNTAASNGKLYRVEEVPPDEMHIAADELLVPVSHFQREIFASFGVPFLIKIKDGESFENVKNRIQRKLDVSDKEFEKYKFAIIVMGRATYVAQEENFNIRLNEFLASTNHNSSSFQNRPHFGLDHTNKTPKRPRSNHMERPIRIHN